MIYSMSSCAEDPLYSPVVIKDIQRTGVVVLVCLSIVLFEVLPEKSVWSISVREADEHMIPLH
jgi:hypothetical protein